MDVGSADSSTDTDHEAGEVDAPSASLARTVTRWDPGPVNVCCHRASRKEQEALQACCPWKAPSSSTRILAKFESGSSARARNSTLWLGAIVNETWGRSRERDGARLGGGVGLADGLGDELGAATVTVQLIRLLSRPVRSRAVARMWYVPASAKERLHAASPYPQPEVQAAQKRSAPERNSTPARFRSGSWAQTRNVTDCPTGTAAVSAGDTRSRVGGV